MCAVCGCLTTGQPAPEAGSYKCVECEEAGKAEKATVKKGDSMPSCKTCDDTKVHWVKA
jgi:hypothetical protein